jgi:outer membrane lipoprotein-sorting protein
MRTACILLLGVSSLSAAAAQTPVDPLDALFAQGRAAQASVTSIRAKFTETTVSSLLLQPVVAEGEVIGTKPIRVVMKYLTPVAKTVWLDATRLVVVWPGRSDREEINITDMQKRVQQYFVDASAKELRQSFDIALSTDPSLHDADLLDMTPKRKQIKDGLSRLRLWVDPVRLVMVKMRMDYADGDVRTLEFHDIVLNAPVDERLFVIPPKSGRGGR